MDTQTNSQRDNPWITTTLLFLTTATLFLLPLFSEYWLNHLYATFLSAIFLCAAYALRGSRSLLFRLSVLIVVVTSVSSFLSEGSYKSIARTLQFIFFILLVVLLIRKIAVSPNVSGLVIMDAVTAYLLLGLAFGIIVLMANTIIPGGFSDPMVMKTNVGVRADFRVALYYAFVTYTTTGYGDILPLNPITKSLSMLISICGQLYVAIILALLVGKFAAKNPETTQKT